MSTGGDSSDDEFDDLFSFNTAATPKGKDTATATEGSSSSPINFDIDLSEREDPDPNTDPDQAQVQATTTIAAPMAVSSSADAVAEDDDDPFASIAIASNSESNSAPAPDSANTSDTSSYYKVSPPSTGISTPPNEDTNDDQGNVNDSDNNENNDNINNFDLGAAKPTMSGLGEDDFHAMDSDTRDFLDFLDKEPEKKTATSTLANQGFSDDESGDDMDDDGDMDFVDINTDSNEQEDGSVSDNASAATASAKNTTTAAAVSAAKSSGILDGGNGSGSGNTPVSSPSRATVAQIPPKKKDSNHQVSSPSLSSPRKSIVRVVQKKDKSNNDDKSETGRTTPTNSPMTSPKTKKKALASPMRLLSARIPAGPFIKPLGAVRRMRSLPVKDNNDDAVGSRSPIGMERQTSANASMASASSSSVSSSQLQSEKNDTNNTMGTDQESGISDGKHGKVMENDGGSILSESSEGDDMNVDVANATAEEPVPEPPKVEIVFESLHEAIHSPESNMSHIRPLFYPTTTTTGTGGGGSGDQMKIAKITSEERPWLWSKAICSKTLSDVETSSLADSFLTWDDQFDMVALVEGANANANANTDVNAGTGIDTNASADIDAKGNCYGLLQEFVQKLLEEVDLLVVRVISSKVGTSDVSMARRDLCSLLLFYYRSTFNSITTTTTMPTATSTSSSKAEEKKSGKGKNMDESCLQFEEEVSENLKMIASEDNGESESTNTNGNDAEMTDGDGEKDASTTDAKEKVEATTSSEDATKDDDDTSKDDKEAETEGLQEKLSSYNIKPKGQFVEWNALIGPIAATLLSSGMAVSAVSVMIARIAPAHLPLVPLMEMERMHAVKTMHQKLYFLICYHLPLLVLHLDKNVPGWFWPKSLANRSKEKGNGSVDEKDNTATNRSRNLEGQGTLPITWFASLLAGEDSSSTLPLDQLLALWDVLLTSDDSSQKFFLALSILERHSDNLLMMKGQELIDELTAIMSLERNEVEVESFVGSDVSTTSLNESQKNILTWCNHARSLRDSTPISVVKHLRAAEDKSVDFALNLRSKLAIEQMKERLEAEAKAHRQAVEEEEARQLEERMHKYYREKLEKFYKRHCPEKVHTIDKIMEVYKGRYDVLDSKLHIKYGRGFLPLISVFNPKVKSKTNKLMTNVGQGIENKKKNIILSRAEQRTKMLEEEMKLDGTQLKHQVAIKVSAEEILPAICGGKKSQISSAIREPLKFYLVDSRPAETREVQGAFPTAARLSPEDLMEPDRIQEKVEMFESLRGGAHIVIMGEGFSSLPSLYGHKIGKIEEKLLDSDESRTNMCALFFIKKGFPFVSVLDGGFAAAHACLARSSEKLTLSDVLVDYDEDTSLFAQLHSSYQEQKEFSSASAGRKTTMAMQMLIENSMVRLTSAEHQLEDFTDRFMAARKEKKGAKEKESQEKLDKETDSISEPARQEGQTTIEQKKGPNDSKTFQNAFAGIRNKLSQKEKDEGPSEVSKTFAGIRNKMSKKEKDDGISDANKSFDFSKISFGRKKQFMRGKSDDDDDELEKEIEASLTPLKDLPNPSSPVRKIRFGRKNDSNENKKKDSPLAFKNTLGVSFGRFNAMKPKPKNETKSALREEELVFFDEED